MDKLKKIFKKDKDDEPAQPSQRYSTPQPTSTATGSAAATGGNTAGASSGAAAAGGSSAAASSGPSKGIEKADSPEGVIMHTNMGDMTIALYKETPKTIKNFAHLAATGKYDNVIFHRIIPGFVLQGGDPTGSGMGGTSIYGGKFEDEIVSSLRHTGKGTLSMANSGPNTNGSQFFVTLAPTPHLDGKHAVFGRVVQGLDVVDKIGAVPTNSKDRPLNDVKILSCEVF